LAGLGVAGDAHAGTTVKHRSRVRRDPTVPNLRQVHLLHAELFDELMAKGFAVWPGRPGRERHHAWHRPAGAAHRHAAAARAEAVVELTGLRNPCSQIDKFQQGLMAAVLDRDAQGGLVRKAGVMAVVLTGGEVHAGAAIRVELPQGEQRPLEPV
jgi:hypothetical protein